MISTEREKLLNKDSKYLSIGITQGGIPRKSVGVPWELTVHAYNMRIPQVYLSPEDLFDEEIMKLLDSYVVVGCYIWAPLDNYEFLSRFRCLEDINIKNGDAIRDLDFLAELYECRMLYIQNAQLKNLDVIADVKKNSQTMFGCLKCIGLDNCRVEDLSVFENERMSFSEFLIWMPEGRGEKDRWSVVSAVKRKYYEYKE